MIQELIKEREYPDVLTMLDNTKATSENWDKRRKEMLSLLETYSYGKTPDMDVKVWGEVTYSDDGNKSYAQKVLSQKVNIHMETELGVFTFPIEVFVPKKVDRPPVFLHLAFRPVPDRYIPVEEITDAGYALVVLVYKDVVNDDHFGDFSDGLGAYFGVNKDRKPDEWGKIGMWAYAASRVMDYLVNERDDIDTDKVAVMGHSRLGKTALWCAAQDERFAAALSNDSGYGGAASSKHGTGERVTDFVVGGSWDWFCENFKDYADEKEDHKPYDQSFLLALVAPRLLCVSSAVLDLEADPLAEFLTSYNASRAWELLGKKGLVCEDRKPAVGDLWIDGHVCYHLRDHGHALSREEWGAFIKFLDSKFK